MTESSEYREANTRARVAIGLLLVLIVGLFFYLHGLIAQILVDIQLMLDSDPKRALSTISRLLLWLVTSGGLIAVAVGFYLCALAVRIGTSGEYPPPSMPVSFRVRIRRGDAALSMRRNCLLLAGLLFCQPVLGLLIWYGLTGGEL